MYSFFGNCAASDQISIFMCLWAIYIFPGSVHIFSCSRIGRLIVGIYKSQTDTRMWKLELWARNSFFWNMFFEFSVLALCSVQYVQIMSYRIPPSPPAKLGRTPIRVTTLAFGSVDLMEGKDDIVLVYLHVPWDAFSVWEYLVQVFRAQNIPGIRKALEQLIASPCDHIQTVVILYLHGRRGDQSWTN